MIGIGVVGMPGSGKSIFSKVASEMGLPVLIMGNAVREEVRRRGLPLTSENLMRTAEELRKAFGRGAVARLIIDKIKKTSDLADSRVIVIEGLRSPEEKKYFDQFFDSFYVVAIHASPRTRYQRILNSRMRKDDFKTIDELKLRDEKELNFGIGWLLALADFHLVNEEKTIEEFESECKHILNKILELN